MEKMIASELNIDEAFVSGVSVVGNYVYFNINGGEWCARLSRGKFKQENMRRA